MQQQQYQTFLPKPDWTSRSFSSLRIQPCTNTVHFDDFININFDDALEKTCDSLRKSIVLLKTMEKLSERIEELKLKKINLEEKSNDHDDDELSLNLAREWFFEAKASETEQSSIQKEKEIINNELRDAVQEKENLDEKLIKLNTGYASLQSEIEVFKNAKKEMKQEFEDEFNLCRCTFASDFEELDIKEGLIRNQKRGLERDVAIDVKKQTEAQAQLNKLMAKDSELRSAKWTKINFKSEKEEEQESLKHKCELFECKKVMLEGKLKLMRDLQQIPTHMLDQKFKEQIALYKIESAALNNDLDSLQQRNQQIEKEIREAIHEINRITWESANLSSSKEALETNNDEHESRQSKLKEKINLIENELRIIEWKQKHLKKTFKSYRKLGIIFDEETPLSLRYVNSSAFLGQDELLEF